MAGEVLKKRREELGLDIKVVSEALKINSEYLSAIEDDAFEKLPVAVYTIGYVRCYANYLDVDAEPVISGFMSHLSSPPKPSTIIPVSSSKRKVPGYLYVVPLLAAGLVAFFAYSYVVKNRTLSVAVPSIKGPVEEKKPPQVLPKETAEKPPTPPANSNAPMGAPLATGQAQADKKEHQLTMTAREAAWFRIKLANGRSEEMLLGPGKSRSWDFDGLASLKIGNAGGVVLTFDGKELGVPGKTGEVVELTFPQGR